MSSLSLDAHGDVLRGLQVVETACGAATALLDEKIEVLKDMDIETRRLPLGLAQGWFAVVHTFQGANTKNSIAPFNFLAMIPPWSIPPATVPDNTLILKLSERGPEAAMILAELCKRAGAAYLFSLPN